MNTQDLGRLLSVPIYRIKDFRDVFPLEVGNRFLQRHLLCIFGSGMEVRDVLEMNRRALGDSEAPFDQILKLSHISRPVVFREHIDCPVREPLGRLAGGLGKAIEKMVQQQADVASSVTEGRDMDRKYIQSVV